MDNITYDDVYEIAAEVAEETITKFLQNLVKLVPDAESVVSDIKNQQYQELKKLKKRKNSVIEDDEEDSEEDVYEEEEPENFEEQRNKEFAQIAHESSLKENVNNFDSVLSQVPLESSSLFDQAQHSQVEDSNIPPAM